MDNTQYLDSYLDRLNALKSIVNTTNERILQEVPDDFFVDNANFFSKSFLVIMCAYLESYLKDVLMIVIDEANQKLRRNKLPHNLIAWSLNIEKELKESEYKYQEFKIPIKKKKLDDFISGSPYRTMNLFKKLGLNLENDPVFNTQKDILNSIVVKRNKVVHYNDEASDVSNHDLVSYIDIIASYLANIDKLICNSIG